MNMKCKSLVLVVTVAAAMALAPLAFGHSSALTVSKACNTQTGNYDLTWTLTATDLEKLPKVTASNRVAIPVGSSPGVFLESVPGNTTSVSASLTVRWNNGVTSTPTASTTLEGTCHAPTPDPVCPEGYVRQGETKPVLCLKETTTTVTLYVDKPYGVPGPAVPGPTVYVDKAVPGPTVYVKVPGPKGKTVYKIVKAKPLPAKVKRVIVRVCPIKKFVEPQLAG